jgi:flagellar biogenesis protein FliO
MATSTVHQELPQILSRLGPKSAWVIVAGVAILGGLLLPQLLPGESAAEKPRAKVEAKGKGVGEYTAPQLPDMPSPQALLTRLATGTVFVLGLAVVSLYGARRWLKMAGPVGTTPGAMKLIETLQLGNRCSLHLVQLGKRDVLIGVDGGGIKTIVPLAASFEDVLSEAEPTDENATIPFQRNTA